MEASITIPNILIQVIFPPVFQDMSESPKDLFLLFLNTLICSSSPDVLLTRGRLLFNILSLSLSPSLFFSSSHFHLSHHIHAHACAGLSDQLQADPLHLPNTNIQTEHLQLSGSLRLHLLFTLLLLCGTSIPTPQECPHICQTTCPAGRFLRLPHLLYHQPRLDLLSVVFLRSLYTSLLTFTTWDINVCHLSSRL